MLKKRSNEKNYISKLMALVLSVMLAVTMFTPVTGFAAGEDNSKPDTVAEEPGQDANEDTEKASDPVQDTDAEKDDSSSKVSDMQIQAEGENPGIEAEAAAEQEDMQKLEVTGSELVFNVYPGHAKVSKSISIKNNTGETIKSGWNWSIESISDPTIWAASQKYPDEFGFDDQGFIYFDKYDGGDLPSGETGDLPFRLYTVGDGEQGFFSVPSIDPEDQIPPGSYHFNMILSANAADGNTYYTKPFPMTINVYEPDGASLKVGEYAGDTVHNLDDFVTARNSFDFGTLDVGSNTTSKSFTLGIMNNSSIRDSKTGKYPQIDIVKTYIEADSFGAFDLANEYGATGRDQLVGKSSDDFFGGIHRATLTADATYLPAGTYTANLVIETSPYKLTWNGRPVTDGKIKVPLKLTVTGTNNNIPAQVQNFDANAGDKYVELKWDKVPAYDGDYIIWRKAYGEEDLEAYQYATDTYYVDYDVENGKTYTYEVSCEVKNAPHSESKDVTPGDKPDARLAAPDVYAENGENGQPVVLRWHPKDGIDYGAGKVNHFVIYRDDSPIMTYSQASYINDGSNKYWQTTVPVSALNQEQTFAVAAVAKSDGKVGLKGYSSPAMSVSKNAELEYGYLEYDSNEKGVVFNMQYRGGATVASVAVTRDGQTLDIDGSYGSGIDKSVVVGKTYTYTFTPKDYNGKVVGNASTFKIKAESGSISQSPGMRVNVENNVVNIGMFIVGGGTATKNYTFNLYRNGSIIKEEKIYAGEEIWPDWEPHYVTDRPDKDGTYVYQLEVVDSDTGAANKSSEYKYVRKTSTGDLLKAPNAPGTPVVAAGNNKVKITWGKPSGGSAPSEYVIYRLYTELDKNTNVRTEDPGGWNEIGRVDAKSSSYIDIGSDDSHPKNGSDEIDYVYKYKVAASNAAGRSSESAESNEANPAPDKSWETSAPGKPSLTDLKIEKNDEENSLYFSWIAADDGIEVTSYSCTIYKNDESVSTDNFDPEQQDDNIIGAEWLKDPEGTYRVEITANNQKGSSDPGTRILVYQPIDMSKCTITEIPDQPETGRQIKPPVEVKYNESLLKEGTDYSLSYGENVSPGTGEVTVTGIGEGGDHPRTGKQTATFKIVANIANANFDFDAVKDKTYDGKGILNSDIKVYDSSKTKQLEEYEDYTIRFKNSQGQDMDENPVDAGNYKIEFTGKGVYAGTYIVPITIRAKDISGFSVTYNEASDNWSSAYNKIGTTVNLDIMDGTKTLTEDEDYEITYLNKDKREVAKMTDAGNYSVVIRGIANYENVITKSFVINKAEVTVTPESGDRQNSIAINRTNVVYNANEQTPSIAIMLNAITLKEGVDYQISYKKVTEQGETAITGKPKDAGTYNVYVSFIGNYVGNYGQSDENKVKAGTFTINKIDIADSDSNELSVSPLDYPSNNGEAVAVNPTITCNGIKLTKEKDFNFTFKSGETDVQESEIKAGSYSMIISGINNYSGSVTKTINIKKDISSSENRIDLSGDDKEINYDGSGKTPKPIIKVPVETGDKTLSEGTDYTISYRDSDGRPIAEPTEPGVYTIVITGKGDYAGEKTITFMIIGDIGTDAEVSGINEIYESGGEAVKPEPVVIFKSKELKKKLTKKDYTVSYVDSEGKTIENPQEAGNYVIVIEGIGCYRGSITENFAIKHVHKYTQRVYRTGGYLSNGYEYYRCLCGEGKDKYKVIPGYANYYVKSFRLSKGKKSFTAKWKKQSKANMKKFNGYQIRWSAKGNMAGARYAYAGKKSRSKKIRGLAKKTYYYVQARSYTVSGGQTYYSGWSGVKRVKTK